MEELTLQVVPMTEERMQALEERGLIQGFLPAGMEEAPAKSGVEVEVVYSTAPHFGPHTLIRVEFDRPTVELAYHSDREDLLLINAGVRQKPLILVIALHPADDLKRRIAQGRLSADDLWALELKFNDPRLSFFTMKAFTVHCEWTPPGPEARNVFFVTEPKDLDMHAVDLGEYVVRVTHASGRAGGA